MQALAACTSLSISYMPHESYITSHSHQSPASSPTIPKFPSCAHGTAAILSILSEAERAASECLRTSQKEYERSNLKRITTGERAYGNVRWSIHTFTRNQNWKVLSSWVKRCTRVTIWNRRRCGFGITLLSDTMRCFFCKLIPGLCKWLLRTQKCPKMRDSQK